MTSARRLIIVLAIVILGKVNGQQRYPRIVQPRIIPHAELSRDRRSVPLDRRANLQFLSLNDWILKTEPSSQLAVSPRLRVEWPGGRAALPLLPCESCESREGEVYGREGSSRVLLTHCRSDEFFGLVNLGNRTYLVEPLLDSKSGQHLLYEAEFSRSRREAADSSSTSPTVYEASKRFYNLSGDTFDQENYQDNPELLSEPNELGRNNELEAGGGGGGSVAEDDDGVAYFYDRNSERDRLPTRKTINKFSPAKWLELAVVADYSVIDFHGSRVQQYIFALLNIVSAIYKDPSLDANMQLVLVRLIFYSEKKDGMVHQGNSRRSLENVNKWNRKLLALSNQSHDAAVWLTRLDIGGPSGYAPVSGACDPSRSCALNRDEGLTSAFIIAHEVAHILGLSHDGDQNSGNTCAREATRGSIMAPMVAATFHNFHWSACSRKEFHRRAKHWSCLLNRPSDDDSPIARGSLNELFSMDEQCRMEFGEGYSRCRNLESSNLCAHLWCGRANSSEACKTKKGPPLEGTLCAENKWCVSGSCEPIEQQRRDPTPLAVRGLAGDTWASWGLWSECSRSCGIALQYRIRRCIGFCQGESKEFRVCNLPACPDRQDLRASQCAKFFREHSGLGKARSDGNDTWLPYESFHASSNCQLVCYRKESSEIFHTGLDVEDGTPCSYETSDICIGGACRSMGCDGVLGSARSRDACGQCDGNNSTCESVAGKFQRKLRRETTRLAVLPKSAHNIKVAVTILLTDSVPHEGNVKILIRDGQRRRHEIREFDADGRAAVMIIEGAAFRAERLEEKYVLWSRGPLMSDIVLSLIAARSVIRTGASISVSSQYTIARSALDTARGRYVWLLAPAAGPCPVGCGGALRRRTLLCRDELTRELVSRRKCLLTAKPPGHRQLERCNAASCDYVWIAGMWERCKAASEESGSCAPTQGVQKRTIYCVRSSLAEHQVTRENELKIYRNTVQPSKCRDQKQPPTERPCSRVPLCSGHWVYGDWSPCSQSCGRGVQTRKARCLQLSPLDLAEQQQLLLDSCNATRIPDEVRACKGMARHSPECSHCRGDRGYCVARDFNLSCRNSVFRRRCCQTCRARSRGG